jgi:hypothetical protein
MFAYRVLHLLKFLGVMLLSGGTAASLLASSGSERQRAAHAIAAPGLLLTWIAGYLLSLQLGVGLGELWTLGGVLFSFGSHVALLGSLSRHRSLPVLVAVVAPLLLTLSLMVFRPTWAMVLP